MALPNSSYAMKVPLLDGGEDRITESAVREGLNRILGSQIFKASARMSRFLGYVVECALDGKHESLKETCIAVAVYDRAPAYDPKLDPVVRSEARRLRRKLEEYYDVEGRDDPVRISLPKGGYTPAFGVHKADTQPPGNLPGIPRESFTPASTANAGNVYVLKQWISRRGIRLGAVLAVSLLAAGVAVHLISLRRGPSGATPFALAQIIPVTSSDGQARQPSISPDGSKVAFAWAEQFGNFSIYVTQAGGRPLRVTTDAASDFHPAWSPNGRSLAFLRKSRDSAAIMILAFPGGLEEEAFPIANRTWNGNPVDSLNNIGPIWTPDGSALIASSQSTSEQEFAIYSHNVRTRAVRQLTFPPNGEDDVCPSVSPNGKWLAFARFSSNSSADISIVPMAGGAERRLTSEHVDIQGITWLPDSEHVLFSSNRSGAFGLWTVDIRGGSPQPMAASGENAIDPSVSSDGEAVVYADWRYSTNIVRTPLFKAKGAASDEILSSTRRSNSAQFSPDGQRIAFISDRTGAWQLWIASADGDDAMKLTDFHSPMVGSPRWSPDGRDLVFDARTNGHSAIFLISAEGGVARRLDGSNAEEKQPFWSRDGRWIYFESNRNGPMGMWKHPVTGGEALLVRESVGSDIQQSQDGSIYFCDSKEHIQRIAAGGTAEPLPSLDRTPSPRLWFVARTGIFFIDVNDNSQLEFYDFQKRSTRKVQTLASPAFGGTPSLSVSSDGRWLLSTRLEQENSNLMLLEERR